jgi:hypothetical protein
MVGMKKKVTQMNSTQIAHVSAHIAAVTKLLLGDRMMKPGLSIIGGEELDAAERLELGMMAAESQYDVVHLAFALNATGVPVMTGINLFLPRDRTCYAWTRCRLSLARGASRAVIVPQDGVRSHFKLLPGEILQVKGRPAGFATDAGRADRKLDVLVRDGVEVTGQVTLHTFATA